jgi:hypothetical protein
MRFSSRFTFALAMPALLATGCTDAVKATAPSANLPAITAADQGAPLTSLVCDASIQTRTVSCASPDDSVFSASRDVLFGGQNQYITLTSTNIQTLADTFAFDVTVKNLIPQAIGTNDGTTAAATGVRVFFNAGPTSTTGGTISVANQDGVGTFLSAAQPYYQYNGVLANNAVSAAKRWKLQFTPAVTHFTFTVYVSAAVQYPNGYVDGTPYVLALNPNEVRTLTGTARTFVGNPVAGQSVAWATSNASIAAVSGAQLTAGSSRGTATLTPTAGSAPGLFATAVSVCQAVVVTTGASLASSIATTDCFSSFGDPNGRPTTSYYADLYRVTLTAGQTVTVTMDSGDDLDTYLLLATGSGGNLVAGNDDDDTGTLGVGSRMVYTAATSGVYVIEASTFNGLDTGNYTLHVTIN